MIEQQLARELIPLTTSPEYAVLQEYVQSRMSAIEKQLTTSTSYEHVCRLQGAHKELVILSKLREHVNSDK